MPAPAHVQASTLDKFLASWRDSKPEDTMALWSDDFQQRILPLSLGMPISSRTEAEAVYPNLVKSLTNWQLDVKQVVHDVAKGTAAVYATSLADTPVPGEKWTNEYAIFITFSEDGHKVCRLEEMLDSAFFRDFFPKLREHMSKPGERQT